jgi:hypothetical protein
MKQLTTVNVRTVKLRCKVWLAIFAFLLQALLPAAMYAAAPGKDHLSEICTAFGIKKIGAPDSSGSDSLLLSQHCPICSVAGLLALPTPDFMPDIHAPAGLSVAVLVADRPAFAPIKLRPYLRGPPIPA